MIYQTFINRSDDFAELRAGARRGASAELHRELTAGPTDGRADRASRAAAGRRDRAASRARSTARACSSPAAAPGSGKAIAVRVRPARRVDRDREPQGRAPRRRRARRSRRSARRSLAVDVRHPRRRDDRRARSTRPRPRSGCPGVLVNNAAANFPVPAEDMSPNAWRTVVDITLNGTFFCAREFGRRHLAAGTPGSIVNVGASYAWTGGPGFAHSAAAKAGVKNLTESLAVEWGPYGIQVNGARARPVPARGHDRRHPRQPRPHARQGRVPAGAARRRSARSWAGRRRSSRRPTPGSSPATRSWSTAPTGSAAADEPAGRDRPRPDGPGPVRPRRRAVESGSVAPVELEDRDAQQHDAGDHHDPELDERGDGPAEPRDRRGSGEPAPPPTASMWVNTAVRIGCTAYVIGLIFTRKFSQPGRLLSG